MSMSFNERRFLMIKITTYLLTLKIVSSGRTEVVILRIILLSILRQHLQKLFWANTTGPTFSTTVCILRSSVMYRLPFRLRKVSSEVWQHTHSDDVGIGRQHAHWHQSEPADVASVHTLAAGGRGLRSCYHAVLHEYTPVRKHNRSKTLPFSLVIMIGPGSTKLRRFEFWLAP